MSSLDGFKGRRLLDRERLSGPAEARMATGGRGRAAEKQSGRSKDENNEPPRAQRVEPSPRVDNARNEGGEEPPSPAPRTSEAQEGRRAAAEEGPKDAAGAAITKEEEARGEGNAGQTLSRAEVRPPGLPGAATPPRASVLDYLLSRPPLAREVPLAIPGSVDSDLYELPMPAVAVTLLYVGPRPPVERRPPEAAPLELSSEVLDELPSPPPRGSKEGASGHGQPPQAAVAPRQEDLSIEESLTKEKGVIMIPESRYWLAQPISYMIERSLAVSGLLNEKDVSRRIVEATPNAYDQKEQCYYRVALEDRSAILVITPGLVGSPKEQREEFLKECGLDLERLLNEMGGSEPPYNYVIMPQEYYNKLMPSIIGQRYDNPSIPMYVLTLRPESLPASAGVDEYDVLGFAVNITFDFTAYRTADSFNSFKPPAELRKLLTEAEPGRPLGRLNDFLRWREARVDRLANYARSGRLAFNEREHNLNLDLGNLTLYISSVMAGTSGAESDEHRAGKVLTLIHLISRFARERHWASSLEELNDFDLRSRKSEIDEILNFLEGRVFVEKPLNNASLSGMASGEVIPDITYYGEDGIEVYEIETFFNEKNPYRKLMESKESPTLMKYAEYAKGLGLKSINVVLTSGVYALLYYGELLHAREVAHEKIGEDVTIKFYLMDLTNLRLIDMDGEVKRWIELANKLIRFKES